MLRFLGGHPAGAGGQKEKAGKLDPGEFCIGVGFAGKFDIRVSKKGVLCHREQETWSPGWIEE